MPRGVPKSGFRKTKNRMAKLSSSEFFKPTVMQPVAPQKVETESEVWEKLTTRFETLDIMSEATAKGLNRSLIVSGPAGLGKSYGVEKVMERMDAAGYVVMSVRGYIRPTGLYKLLYENRFKKCIITFDDADSIFSDDVCLNILKAACDMTQNRRIHWLTETRMLDEEGDRLPRKFDFEGSIIFITNYDFDDMIRRGSKLAPHFEALISRSHYLDLAMKTRLDYIVRIKQVVKEKGMLSEQGFTKNEENDILDFIQENQEKLRELSLRMVAKIATLMRMNQKSWKKLASVTCMR